MLGITPIAPTSFGDVSGLPKFDLDYRKIGPNSKPNSIVVTVNGEEAALDIRSGFGIGTGTIALTDGVWPKKVVVRLHLAGLEGLFVSNREKTLNKGHLHVCKRDLQGQLLEGNSRPQSVDSNTTASSEPLNSYYEATIPASLLGPEVKELQVRWVDFFRG